MGFVNGQEERCILVEPARTSHTILFISVSGIGRAEASVDRSMRKSKISVAIWAGGLRELGEPRPPPPIENPLMWHRLSAARSQLSFETSDKRRRVRFQHPAKIAQLHDVQTPNPALDISHEGLTSAERLGALSLRKVPTKPAAPYEPK